MSEPKKKFDCRCPLKLDSAPDSWCSLAVQRLKALRNAGKELTEEEESKLPGCVWAIDHQLANYCFFKYMKEYSDKNLSDMEIASLNNISIDTVKKIEKTALTKVRENAKFKRIKDENEGEAVVSEHHSDDDYKIYR